MVTTRWQQQNFQTRNVGLALTGAVLVVVTTLLLSNGLAWMSQWLGNLVVIVGLLLTYRRMKLNAEMMTRILRNDYEEIERDFRVIFKENHIRYYRRVEEDSYYYEFPGRSLTMRVEPYIFHNLLFVKQQNPQPAASIRLSDVTTKNVEFANFLADSIDERMAERRGAW